MNWPGCSKLSVTWSGASDVAFNIPRTSAYVGGGVGVSANRVWPIGTFTVFKSRSPNAQWYARAIAGNVFVSWEAGMAYRY